MQSPIEQLIETALAEDIGLGDRTTEALVDDSIQGEANMLAKGVGVLCGMEIAERVFAAVDPSLMRIHAHLPTVRNDHV